VSGRTRHENRGQARCASGCPDRELVYLGCRDSDSYLRHVFDHSQAVGIERLDPEHSQWGSGVHPDGARGPYLLIIPNQYIYA